MVQCRGRVPASDRLDEKTRESPVQPAPRPLQPDVHEERRAVQDAGQPGRAPAAKQQREPHPQVGLSRGPVARRVLPPASVGVCPAQSFGGERRRRAAEVRLVAYAPVPQAVGRRERGAENVVAFARLQEAGRGKNAFRRLRPGPLRVLPVAHGRGDGVCGGQGGAGHVRRRFRLVQHAVGLREGAGVYRRVDQGGRGENEDQRGVEKPLFGRQRGGRAGRIFWLHLGVHLHHRGGAEVACT